MIHPFVRKSAEYAAELQKKIDNFEKRIQSFEKAHSRAIDRMGDAESEMKRARVYIENWQKVTRDYINEDLEKNLGELNRCMEKFETGNDLEPKPTANDISALRNNIGAFTGLMHQLDNEIAKSMRKEIARLEIEIKILVTRIEEAQRHLKDFLVLSTAIDSGTKPLSPEQLRKMNKLLNDLEKIKEDLKNNAPRSGS